MKACLLILKPYFFSDTDVLDKLAFVEAQQRYQTQLLNHILLALQNTDHANRVLRTTGWHKPANTNTG